jgi:hypothetical protein
MLGRIATWADGGSWELDLTQLVVGVGLEPRTVEQVNLARVSSVVVCRRS